MSQERKGPAITPEARARLLDELRGGHDLESAAATADLDLDTVRGDHKLLAECSEAFKLGTARLRARMLEGALKSGDVHIIERAVQARDQAQREMFRPSSEVTDGWNAAWDALDDDCLLVAHAILIGDVAEVTRLIHYMAMREAQQLARVEADLIVAKRIERGEFIVPRHIEELSTLDESAPLPANRAMVPIEARPSLSSPLVR